MNEINTIVLGMSSSVTNAISMQVNAHSTGLMQMNSALNQQRNSMLQIGHTVMGFKKMGSGKLNKKMAKLKKGL